MAPRVVEEKSRAISNVAGVEEEDKGAGKVRKMENRGKGLDELKGAHIPLFGGGWGGGLGEAYLPHSNPAFM